MPGSSREKKRQISAANQVEKKREVKDRQQDPTDIRNVERLAALPAARRGPWADNNMLDRRLQLYLVGDSLGHHTHDHNQVSTDS